MFEALYIKGKGATQCGFNLATGGLPNVTPLLGEYLANSVFWCVFMRDRSQSTKSRILTDLPSKIGLSRVPMMGFEPIPRFSRERILSPLRLPFRHIGFSLSYAELPEI